MSLAIVVDSASSLLYLGLLALCIVGMVRRKRFAFPFLFLAIAFLVIAGVSVSSILERVIGFTAIDRAEEYAEILMLPFVLLFSYAWSAAERLERNRAYVGELHHRVKNNLQVVESLLDLQTDESEGAAREALVAARSRASIVGLTERMAMEGGELDDLDMAAYLRAVVQKTLAAELDAGLEEVSRRYRVDCPDLRFGPATALPCGLIVTEFLLADLPLRDTARQERVIRLRSTTPGRVRLSFHGFPDPPAGLASDLIGALRDQLGAAADAPADAPADDAPADDAPADDGASFAVEFAPWHQKEAEWPRPES